jgi:hypothetical protein
MAPRRLNPTIKYHIGVDGDPLTTRRPTIPTRDSSQNQRQVPGNALAKFRQLLRAGAGDFPSPAASWWLNDIQLRWAFLFAFG